MTRTAFDEIREDEYSVAHEAAQIGMLLINKHPAHEHLQAATVGYVFRDDEVRSRGKVVAADCIMVERILQSETRYRRLVKWALARILGADILPDFLILIDRNIWDGMDPGAKLALVDHELCHAWYQTEDDGVTQKFHKDGSPMWSIKGHDVEAFTGEVARNGLWTPELVEMARVMITNLAENAEAV